MAKFRQKKERKLLLSPIFIGISSCGKEAKIVLKKSQTEKKKIKFARLLITPLQIDAIKAAAASRSASFAETVGTRGSH
jgi:hypothetical protein